MRLAIKSSLALALCTGLLGMLGAGTASADFGIASYATEFQNPGGGEVTQAGAHADVFTDLEFQTTTGGDGQPIMDGQLRDLEVELPGGFAGNPQAIPTCEMDDIVKNDGRCNPAAQVGVFHYEAGPGIFIPFPVYNMKAPDEQTAVLAVLVVSIPTKIVISARTDSDFGLTARLSNISQGLSLQHSKLTLWGVPADAVHDPLRSCGFSPCEAEIEPKPFLSMPVRCEPATTTLHADSWQNPGARRPDGSADLSDPDWKSESETTAPLEGCEELDFRPSLKARPTNDAADSPSGLEADLELPQNADDPAKPASAMPRAVSVQLPEGLVINPSGANGLQACTPQQIGLTTPVAAGDPHFTKAPPSCPDAASIGRVEVETPAFADPLKGRVYAMAPYDNPFGTLLGIYVVIEGHGLVIKQAARVSTDPVTGRLATTFDQIPQLPFEHFKLYFDGGSAAILRTPATCGPYATTSSFTPWSAPQTPTVVGGDDYAIGRGAGGRPCASSEAQLPQELSLQSGSTPALAGRYAPFGVDLRRDDGTQQVSSVNLALPPGLLAKLAGSTYCADVALAAAAQKDGKAEQASASCPGTSQVGSVTVGSGAGPKPFYASGTAYLAGPYKGAPLSLAVVVPAVAGPFDLGTVVVRNALHVDPSTAQVTVKSDPLPQILQGIPLDVRSISVRLDKPQFTKNPTSCNPFQVTGSLLSAAGATAPLTNSFQVAECGRLGFKPKLRISLKGKTKRTGNPALTAVLRMPQANQANIAKTTVILPKTMFIDNAHISNPCTRVQFKADQCPAKSILGKATAFSPLLDEPLRGPVYFRSNGGDRELPDLVADLDGQIHVTLVGFIDSVKVKGTESSRIRTRFLNVPDAPVSRFVLRMAGGRKGLIENSVNLCAKPQFGTVQMEAHNADTRAFEQRIGTSCGKKGKKQKRSGKR